MLLFAKLLMFLVVITVAFRAVWFWRKNHTVRTADLSAAILTMFYVMPMVYDALGIGYSNLKGFPEHVQVRYCFVISGTIAIIQAFSRLVRKRYASFHTMSRQYQLPIEPAGNLRTLYQLSWLGMLLPAIAVFAIANPADYITYGNLANRGVAGVQSARFAQTIVSITSMLALFFFFVAFWVSICKTRRMFSLPTIMAVIFALIPVYLHGKRSIIFIVLVIACASAFLEARLKVRYIILASLSLIFFSFFYIGQFKALDSTSAEYLRGDLSRDYTLSFAIDRTTGFSENTIVPYRNAGYEFQLVIYVPRAWYPDKPWPTSVYFTNRLMGNPKDDYMGWAVGMGFIDEAFANAGYAAWLIACCFVGLLAGWIDRMIYCKSSYFLLLWAPFLYGHVFALNVIFKIVLFAIIPALIVQALFTRPGSWVASNAQPHY